MRLIGCWWLWLYSATHSSLLRPPSIAGPPPRRHNLPQWSDHGKCRAGRLELNSPIVLTPAAPFGHPIARRRNVMSDHAQSPGSITLQSIHRADEDVAPHAHDGRAGPGTGFGRRCRQMSKRSTPESKTTPAPRRRSTKPAVEPHRPKRRRRPAPVARPRRAKSPWQRKRPRRPPRSSLRTMRSPCARTSSRSNRAPTRWQPGCWPSASSRRRSLLSSRRVDSGMARS